MALTGDDPSVGSSYAGYGILGLDVVDEAVYRALLRQPDDDLSALCSALTRDAVEVAASLTRLRGRGLVRPSPHAACGMVAVSPELALAATLAQREAELAERRQRLEQGRAATARLVAEHAMSEAGRREHRVERLRGVAALARRTAELVAGAEHEVLSLDTSTWRATDPARRVSALGDASGVGAVRHQAAVVFRAIHLDVLRHDPEPFRLLRARAAAGVRVRTLPSLPLRMLVVDGAVALLPGVTPAGQRGDPDRAAADDEATVLASPLVAQALCALFESLWRKASPLAGPTPPDVSGLSAAERELLRLLSTGLTDEGASRKLGLSLRTVRRMMSELMGRLEAKSRFQAGVRVAERRWL